MEDVLKVEIVWKKVDYVWKVEYVSNDVGDGGICSISVILLAEMKNFNNLVNVRQRPYVDCIITIYIYPMYDID